MIIPLSALYPRENRTRQYDPVTFGNECETWRSTYTENRPGMPQVLLVEQSPCSELLPHYHASDQFQIFVQGEGTLGKHRLQPISIHYTNRHTSYGPIIAGDKGIQYYVMRPSFDVLGYGQYLHNPVMRDNLRRYNGRKRVLMADVALYPVNILQGFGGLSVTRCFGAGPEDSDSGLFADAITLGPHTPYRAPDPRSGGGQIITVVQGSLLFNGTEMGERAAIAVTEEEEEAISFVAGDLGLHALVLQYPKRTIS